MPTKPVKDQLVSKVEQLGLDFGAEQDVFAPFFFTPEDREKVFLPLELVKFPFFLHSKSEKVLESRKGFAAYKKYEKLVKQGLSEKEIREQTKYESSPTDLIKQYDNWRIQGHQNHGLPDSFDGQVWNVLIGLISDILQKTGQFYLIYTITPNMIEQDFIRRDIYKSRSGKTRERIGDALHRLAHTSYVHSKGTYRKDSGEYIPPEQYSFSLLTGIYEKGSELPTGEVTSKFAVAVDPIVILNLRRNHFLIVLHKRRDVLKEFGSVTLFDKLSYFVYQDLQNDQVFLSQYVGMYYHRVISYYKICEYLGLEPLKGVGYTITKVKRQLARYHEELRAELMLHDIIYQEKGRGADKKINLVYVFTNSFTIEMFRVLSNQAKEKERIFTEDDRKKYIGYVQRQIGDPKVVQQLFYRKNIAGN